MPEKRHLEKKLCGSQTKEKKFFLCYEDITHSAPKGYTLLRCAAKLLVDWRHGTLRQCKGVHEALMRSWYAESW